MSLAVPHLKEEWRTVPSFPRYRASSLGRVIGAKGRVLKQWRAPDGYMKVSVYAEPGGMSVKGVHQLVCEAFHGQKPTAKHQVAHFDGTRVNNEASNLRWATSAENHADKDRHGTVQRLDQHPRAKLSVADVQRIKREYAAAKAGRVYVKRGTRERLARELGVAVSLIKDVVNGRSWGSVE